ncbi:MAG: CPBP family intramembrane metalloprotease, partial [Candidatus Hydrogenedentes bacterium]|nr:CPBP family intramembrane metalloprotease [Candidatus Hydrogenedentota bacterium]
KWEIIARGMLWTFSWLIGWEFLHRYFLLRPFAARWPRFGWLIVPFSEGVYHLQKAPIEAAGMVVFSLVLTAWALRRRNALLPFLAHLLVEIELVLFLVLA